MKIFGVAGWKNAGKTGLMERLVAEITSRGFTVATIKHAHHGFDVDQPGKDSHRHRQAGAQQVLISSAKRWALLSENRAKEEPALADLLARLSPADLVLVEGYKRDRHPKIEAYRRETGNPLIAADDPSVVAIAADAALSDQAVPVFDLNDTSSIADFILGQVGLAGATDKHATGLANDCFALPAGVDWIPVDKALATLQRSLAPVVETNAVPVAAAGGRVLAEDVRAARSNPPAANAAVDGYGMAHAALVDGHNELPLVPGRAAAGAAYTGTVPRGSAIRILTGALVPAGVDTVVMQEDVSVESDIVRFDGLPKPGANTRAGGEDIAAGDIAVSAGTALGAQHLALVSAVGCPSVSVFQPLRVGVLSTGDELADPSPGTPPDKTFDANRPMLLRVARAWNHQPVDLGHVGDDRAALRDCLNAAAGKVDAILTSGGASAGDEDHVSALLGAEGTMTNWRVALKPGRPLALGQWHGVPVFGLPGNPVAAFVCTLIFARPALSVLAGGGWLTPQAFEVPAAFSKNKKAGRREFLRARMGDDARVKVFASEGSGRITGLAWADGLVDLPDEAQEISPGDPVRYLPYTSFGL